MQLRKDNNTDIFSMQVKPRLNRVIALNKILKIVAANSASALVYGSAIMGVAALIPSLQLPPELALVGSSIGVEALGILLDRLSSGEKLTDTQLLDEIQHIFLNSGHADLLSKDEFYNALALLRRGQSTISSQNQLLLDTIKQVQQSVELTLHDRKMDTSIAKVLMETFFSKDSLDYFCFQYFPDIYNKIETNSSLGPSVETVLAICQSTKRQEELVAALSRFSEGSILTNQIFSAKIANAKTRTQMHRATRNPNQVFISHSFADGDIAHKIAGDLRNEGIPVWIAPSSIRMGEKWLESIERGLDESGIMLLLLTPAATASHWVKLETNAALELESQGKMKFLPILIEDCSPPSMWGAFQWLPMNDGDYRRGILKLLEELFLLRKITIRTGTYGSMSEATRIALPYDGCKFCGSPCEYLGYVHNAISSDTDQLADLMFAVKAFDRNPRREAWDENWLGVARACQELTKPLGLEQNLDAAYCFLVQYIDFRFTKHMRIEFSKAYERLSESKD